MNLPLSSASRFAGVDSLQGCHVCKQATPRTRGNACLPSLLWILAWAHQFVSSASKAPLVHATLEVHTRTVELEMPISLARRKDAFHRSLYRDIRTPEGVRVAEPVLTHRRKDGSFQLLYNTCVEQDSHSNEDFFDTVPFYGCVARLLSISATGVQVGGEKAIDFRHVLPESRVVGYWTPVEDPVNGQNDVEEAIFAVWAAVCPTAADTCECTQARCEVSLDQDGNRSAFRDFASSSTFTVEKGDRLCNGGDSGSNRLGRSPLGRFVYWLVEGTGWVCGLPDQHGAFVEFDEDHPDGVRVGSIFLVRIRKGDVGYDVVNILAGARLVYPFGFNALAVDRNEITSDSVHSGDDADVAIVVRGRYFDEKARKTEPGCFALALKNGFSLSPVRAVLKMPCRPCGFAAVMPHPYLEKLLTVCEETGNPRTVFVDGKAVVTSLVVEDSGSQHHPQAFSPVFVADDFRSWNMVWLNTTVLSEASGKTKNVLSSITLSNWNQQLQEFSKGAELKVRRAPFHVGNRHYAAAFGDSSLLLAYQEADQTAVLAEVALNGSIVNNNMLKVTRNVAGTFLPLSYGNIFMRRHEKEITWYSQWDDGTLEAYEPACPMAVTRSSRRLRLITVKESDDTRTACTGAFGGAGAPCDESCHQLLSYEAGKPSEQGSSCPFANGAAFAEPCFEGNCSYVAIRTVTTPTSANGYFAADGNLETSVKSVGPSSILEITLRSPSEIWALKGYFVPHGKTIFNVTLLDPNQSVIYTKATKLSGDADRGLTFWEWRDMLFYRVQYVRLETSVDNQAGNYLDLAEFLVAGRELEFCPPDGFFASASQGCAYRIDFLLKSAEIWDCRGEWSEWSYCDSTCRSTRFLNVQQQALYGGKPCLLFEKKPCTGGPFCNAFHPREPLASPQSQDCISVPSEWSECRGCRRLKINHRAREASGHTGRPCPPILETEACGPPCDPEYDKWKLRGSASGEFTGLVHLADWKFVYLTVAWASLLMGTAAALTIACRQSVWSL